MSFLARFDGGEPPAENTGSSRLLPEEEIIFVHQIRHNGVNSTISCRCVHMHVSTHAHVHAHTITIP